MSQAKPFQPGDRGPDAAWRTIWTDAGSPMDLPSGEPGFVSGDDDPADHVYVRVVWDYLGVAATVRCDQVRKEITDEAQ